MRGNTNFGAIAVILFAIGAGHGIFGSPNSAVAMTAVPNELRGVASGLRTMIIFLGQVLGMIMLFGVLAARVPLPALMKLFLYGGGSDSGADAIMNAISVSLIPFPFLFLPRPLPSPLLRQSCNRL